MQVKYYNKSPKMAIKICPVMRSIAWECGSLCQSGAIIDPKTGAIYYTIPTASFGFDFRKDSKLLIVNPHKAIKENFAELSTKPMVSGLAFSVCGTP